MDGRPIDCVFVSGKDRFRYRCGAIIVSGGYALFGCSDCGRHYYSVGGAVHLGETSEQAVLRETAEETGEEFRIVRPLCLLENFFVTTAEVLGLKPSGSGSPESFDQHVLEVYYLLSPVREPESYESFQGKDHSVSEKMCWLPVDRLDDFDIRPTLLKDLVRLPPKEFKLYINNEIG